MNDRIGLLILIICGFIILFVGLLFYLLKYANRGEQKKFLNLYEEYYTLDWFKGQKDIVLKCIAEDCNYETMLDYPDFEKMFLEAKNIFPEKAIIYFDCPVCKSKKVLPLDFYKHSNYFKYQKNEKESK